MITDPMTILRRLYEIGCPTYREGTRCAFCDVALRDSGTKHESTCEWLEVERLFVNEEVRRNLQKQVDTNE